MPQYLLNIIQPDGGAPEPEFLEPIMRDLDALNAEMRRRRVGVHRRLHAADTPPSCAIATARR